MWAAGIASSRLAGKPVEARLSAHLQLRRHSVTPTQRFRACKAGGGRGWVVARARRRIDWTEAWPPPLSLMRPGGAGSPMARKRIYECHQSVPSQVQQVLSMSAYISHAFPQASGAVWAAASTGPRHNPRAQPASRLTVLPQTQARPVDRWVDGSLDHWITGSQQRARRLSLGPSTLDGKEMSQS